MISNLDQNVRPYPSPPPPVKDKKKTKRQKHKHTKTKKDKDEKIKRQKNEKTKRQKNEKTKRQIGGKAKAKTVLQNSAHTIKYVTIKNISLNLFIFLTQFSFFILFVLHDRVAFDEQVGNALTIEVLQLF
jgi:hypothetical protein